MGSPGQPPQFFKELLSSIVMPVGLLGNPSEAVQVAINTKYQLTKRSFSILGLGVQVGTTLNQQLQDLLLWTAMEKKMCCLHRINFLSNEQHLGLSFL